MKADQLMQNKKQSCKAQSKVCPPCPKPHTGQKSLFTEQHKIQNKCSLPRGDYNLKTRVIERLLLVQNQFHLLSFNPLSVLCLSSNYLSIFFRQSLKQRTLTIYYLCQYLKEANIIFLYASSRICYSVHRFMDIRTFDQAYVN